MANSALSGNTSGLATATSPGLVGTGAQTFAGKKTLDGGALIKGDTSGVAIAAGYVGEVFQINGSSAALSTSIINLASQAVTPGTYFVTAQAQILTGSSALTYLGVGTSVTSAAFEANSRYEISAGFNNNPSFQISGKIYYITSNSTIYLVGQVAGTVGTGTWYSAGSRLTIIRLF